MPLHPNSLYYGDNLEVLRNRDDFPNDSVDLIYLDPPFNSKRDYNVIYKTPTGHESDSQITAFEDSWHWGEQAEREYLELVRQPNTDLSELIQALRRFLKETDMMAYLVMMANRLLEMHRILKPTGSLYLHCDPTASHYLKIVLDGVFGKESFRNEIVRKHDVILFYAREDNYFNMPKTEWTREDIIKTRKQEIHLDENGIEWIWMPGGKGNSKNKLKKIEDIIKEGKAISDVWQIPIISSSSKERLGYPTQKPLALLERIISASSNPGDVVLDPFCGCGTAVHAAQKLNRKWIGIDITHLAISLIEKRMKDAFLGITFEVHGVPKDFEGAEDLARRDKYQFQWWACSLVNAQPYQGKRKGSDTGIDGLIFPLEDPDEAPKKIIVSVKGGEHVGSAMIRDLKGVVEREKAIIGLFVTLSEPTKDMLKEASSAGFHEVGSMQYPKIQILTIKGLLEDRERPEYFDQHIIKGSGGFKKAKKEESSLKISKLPFRSVDGESIAAEDES
ncbi:MAG: DNA methyltransferase [Leptospirales bacterium]